MNVFSTFAAAFVFCCFLCFGVENDKGVGRFAVKIFDRKYHCGVS